jgi:diguanylate cyclase
MTSNSAFFRGAPGLERAHTILARMADLGIPPAPDNYEIWATYVDGSLPELSRELDARLARGEPFTDEANETLHDQFFANTRVAVHILETSKNIAGELGGVVSALDHAGTDTRAYAALLHAAGADASDPLVCATLDAAERQERLAEQMEVSARLIADMRAALSSIRLQALTDGLTGLPNRRMFDETLSKRIAEAEADRTSLCVLLLDIDHFTRINTAWGGQIGDQFLRYVGSVLREHVKGDALAARLDADCFAIVAPRTCVDLGEAMAARVSRAVKSRQLTRRSTGDAIGSVTLSVGVGCYRTPEDAASLMHRVNACLTAAKHAGGERILTDLKLDRLQASFSASQDNAA